MFWNKKKSKSKPQIKTPTPKPIKTKEPPPKWEPPFGETKKKEVLLNDRELPPLPCEHKHWHSSGTSLVPW